MEKKGRNGGKSWRGNETQVPHMAVSTGEGRREKQHIEFKTEDPIKRPNPDSNMLINNLSIVIWTS